MLKGMKVAERGRRGRGVITLRKAPKKLSLKKWRGRCAASLAEMGYRTVDRYIEDVRGR